MSKTIELTISEKEYEQLVKISELMKERHEAVFNNSFPNMGPEAFTVEAIAAVTFDEGLRIMLEMWEVEESK